MSDELMDKLIKAVSYKYSEDKTAPGIVVSSLKRGQYYCSVVRYSQAFAKGGKQVVCNARGSDLPATLKELANKFLKIAARPKDPVQELGSLIGNDK